MIPLSTRIVVAGAMPVASAPTIRERFPEVVVREMAVGGSVPEDAEVAFVGGLSPDELAALLVALPHLRWLHAASSGFDRLDLPALSRRGVRVTRTASARATTMAEFVLASTLALTRELPRLWRAQAERRWQRVESRSLMGSTVGIVGAGAVGRAAAERFVAFGARLLGIRGHPRPTPGFHEVWAPARIDDLLAASDVVVLACPLNEATRHLLDGRRLALLRPWTVLVNVARGAVIDEADLIAALRAGRLGGAALDVFEQEPLDPESPLWSLPNVLVSPHCSSAGPDVASAVVEEFLENLGRFLQGDELANLVAEHE